MGSAYYIIAVVAPSGEELDAVSQACIAEPWEVTDWFQGFTAAVNMAGIVLVPTRLGTPDFIDGPARATCCLNDKLLLLLILLFSSKFQWIDGAPPSAPKPVIKYIAVIQNWTGRRFPLAHF